MKSSAQLMDERNRAAVVAASLATEDRTPEKASATSTDAKGR